MVVQNRKLLTVDVARLKQQAQEAVENLAELNAETRALAEQLEKISNKTLLFFSINHRAS